MKKLSLLLLLPIFLFSCSNDDNETDNVEPTQDYTSFVVRLQNTVSDNLVLPNCVVNNNPKVLH